MKSSSLWMWGVVVVVAAGLMYAYVSWHSNPAMEGNEHGAMIESSSSPAMMHDQSATDAMMHDDPAQGAGSMPQKNSSGAMMEASTSVEDGTMMH